MRTLPFVLLMLAVPAFGQPDRAAFAADADAFIEATRAAADAIPGLGVAVVHDGEIVYENAFGLADREAGWPATSATPFYIASATKPFVALAAVLLDREGAIDLDLSLQDAFPDVAFLPEVQAERVTLRTLLDHTHGLDNDAIVIRTAYTGQHDPATLHRLLARTTEREDAPLGTFKYTNLGYNILSLYLQEALGEDWRDLVARLVVEPAGMTHTSAYASDADFYGWRGAAPYAILWGEGPQRVYLAKHDDTMQAAGGMIASTHDLARWLVLHTNAGRIDGRQVIPADVIAEVHEQRTEAETSFGPFSREGYALGWYTGPLDGERLLHHFGGFTGFHTHTSFMPDHDLGVVVLANEASAAARIVPLIATYLYARWLGRDLAPYEEQRAALADTFRQQLERGRAAAAERADRTWQLSLAPAAYAGTYVNDAFGTLVVTVRDGAPVVRFGNLWAVATPFSDPETIRVELDPGSGQVVGFDVEDGRVVAARLFGERFERAL